MEEQNKKLIEKHVRKVRACLKRIQSNSDSLKELMTLQELEEFAQGLSAWDKFISEKINK